MEGDGATARAQARKRGLYILMSPHSQGAGVAQQFAAKLGTRMYEGKDAKDLTHLASSGAVVFVLVSDGQALRLVRDVQQMALKSNCVALCLLDVSQYAGVAYVLLTCCERFAYVLLMCCLMSPSTQLHAPSRIKVWRAWQRPPKSCWV